MKIALHAIIWLAVLIGGIWLVGTVFRSTSQGGTGNGAGFFEYSFRSYYTPDKEGDSSISYIELKGRAPKRFKFYGGVSPIYDTISMEWSLFSDYEGRPEGQILLNLDSGTISNGQDMVPLDIDSLISVIGISDNTDNRDTLQYLLNILEDCHTGKLPKPNHHGYTLEGPMRGRMQHFASGYMVSSSILEWVGLWMIAIPVFYTLRRLSRIPQSNSHS